MVEGRELIEQATQSILFRRQGTLDKLPTVVDRPDGRDLRFGERYLLVLSPGEETTTVEVRDPRTGAHLETLRVDCREPEELASEVEYILQRHAGPDA